MRCVSIITSTGLPCGCRVNDDGDRCGRHGGLTRARAVRLRQLEARGDYERIVHEYPDQQDLESLMVEFGNARISPKVKIKLVILDNVDKYYCGICTEDVDSKDTGCRLKCCKKEVCKECLERWIGESPSCPYCRKSVVS